LWWARTSLPDKAPGIVGLESRQGLSLQNRLPFCLDLKKSVAAEGANQSEGAKDCKRTGVGNRKVENRDGPLNVNPFITENFRVSRVTKGTTRARRRWGMGPRRKNVTILCRMEKKGGKERGVMR